MDEEDRQQMLAAQQAGFHGMDPQAMAALMQNCANQNGMNQVQLAAMQAQANIDGLKMPLYKRCTI